MGYTGRNWACPYYRHETKKELSCDGALIRLRDMELRNDFYDNFCDNVLGWEQCPIAKLLNIEAERGEARPVKINRGKIT